MRMTKEARNVYREAGIESLRRQDGYVGTEHMLLGLLANPVGLAATITGLTVEDARAALVRLDDQALAAIGITVDAPDAMRKRNRRMSVPDSTKRLFGRARREADRRGSKTIEVRDWIMAITDTERPSIAIRVLEELGCDPAAIRAKLNERAAS